FKWICKKNRSLIGTVFCKVKLYIYLLIIVHHVFLLSYVPVYISFYYTFRQTLFLLSFCPWWGVVYIACKNQHGLAFWSVFHKMDKRWGPALLKAYQPKNKRYN